MYCNGLLPITPSNYSFIFLETKYTKYFYITYIKNNKRQHVSVLTTSKILINNYNLMYFIL
jgi:hypothetical protein